MADPSYASPSYTPPKIQTARHTVSSPFLPSHHHSGSDQMCISLSFCFVCEFKPGLITHPAVV